MQHLLSNRIENKFMQTPLVLGNFQKHESDKYMKIV